MRRGLFLIIILFSKVVFAEEIKEHRSMIDSYWSGSLMFTMKDLEKLRKSLSLYHNKLEDLANSLNGQGNSPTDIDYFEKKKFTNFFLSSLTYNSENDWTIWLNDKKITSKEKINFGEHLKIEVKQVSKYSATFEIFVQEIEALSPNWKEYLDIVDGELYRSKKYPINYWKNQRKLEVILYPNQDFIIYQMMIIEAEKPPEKKEN